MILICSQILPLVLLAADAQSGYVLDHNSTRVRSDGILGTIPFTSTVGVLGVHWDPQ